MTLLNLHVKVTFKFSVCINVILIIELSYVFLMYVQTTILSSHAFCNKVVWNGIGVGEAGADRLKKVKYL